MFTKMNSVGKVTKKYKLGYNARLDKSLGKRRGSQLTKKTSYKSRRAGSRNLEKYWEGRRAFNVNTMQWKKRQIALKKKNTRKYKLQKNKPSKPTKKSPRVVVALTRPRDIKGRFIAITYRS